MKFRHHVTMALAIAVLAAGGLSAQFTICSGANHVDETHDDYVLAPGAKLAVQFTPESSFSIERIEFLFASPAAIDTVTPSTVNHGTGAGDIEVRLTDPVTGLPSTVIASGSYVDAIIGGGILIMPVGGWHGATFSSPVVLSNGVPYWITYIVGSTMTAIFPNAEAFLAVDVSASPEPTPYTTRTSASAGWQPVLTDQFFKFRVMSTDCEVTGPTASVVKVGSGCGSASLSTTGSPALGSPAFTVGLHTDGGVVAALFSGTMAAGSTSFPGGCSLYLDAASVLPAVAVGMTSLTGWLEVTTHIPLIPGLAGVQFHLQGAAIVSNGPVLIGQPGLGLVMTDALVVTLGY